MFGRSDEEIKELAAEVFRKMHQVSLPEVYLSGSDGPHWTSYRAYHDPDPALDPILTRLKQLECPHAHVRECVSHGSVNATHPDPGFGAYYPNGHDVGTLTARTCLDCGKELSRKWVEDSPKKRRKK